MERLTSDNTFEMDMTELALNQVFVRDGWAWYRKAPEDECSVCDLIRSVAADGMRIDGIELDPNLTDEDLGDIMLDWLQFGEKEPEGVLAILYRALWAMAELRERLKKYEDTGLEPQEITTEPYGCVFYCNRKCNLDGDFCAEGPGCPYEINAETAKHLLELAQAEKDGRMVVLPCKIGDVIYMPVGRCGITGFEEDKCDGYYINREGILQIKAECHSGNHGTYGVTGKTVFLTREEAEAALKNREADNEAVR